MSELELQKARWAREDELRERERKEKLLEDKKRNEEIARIKSEAKAKEDEFNKKAALKRTSAKNKIQLLMNNIKNRQKRTETKSIETKPKKISFGKAYSSTLLKYFGSIVILLINLLAVSISLNCNKDSNLIIRIILACLAFFFSIPYIVIHLIRIVIFKKERCRFNKIKFFV